jgi:hypothetical protein
MSVHNQNIGLTAVNNIGNGTVDALRLPANGSVLIEDFANRYQHLETPLQIFVDGNLNPDGTSRLQGDIQQAFTQAERNISHLHRSSFPSTVSFQSRETIDLDDDPHNFSAPTVNPTPVTSKSGKSGELKKINLRDIMAAPGKRNRPTVEHDSILPVGKISKIGNSDVHRSITEDLADNRTTF